MAVVEVCSFHSCGSGRDVAFTNVTLLKVQLSLMGQWMRCAAFTTVAPVTCAALNDMSLVVGAAFTNVAVVEVCSFHVCGICRSMQLSLIWQW